MAGMSLSGQLGWADQEYNREMSLSSLPGAHGKLPQAYLPNSLVIRSSERKNPFRGMEVTYL